MNGNFSAIPREMLDDNRLKALDIAVYAALDSFADSGGKAWPSIPAIAKRARVSPATVKRSLSRLEDIGYVVRNRRHAHGSREFDTTLYRLVFRNKETDFNDSLAVHVGSTVDEASSEVAGGSALAVSNVGSEGMEVSSDVCDTSALSDQEVGSEGARKYTHKTRTNEREHDARYPLACVSSPMLSDDNSPTEKTLKGVMTHEEEIDRLFDELWERYPQKIYRGDAKEAFRALFPENISREVMERRLAAINERFVHFEENAERLIQRGDERYIPSLRNWLTKEGFCDA